MPSVTPDPPTTRFPWDAVADAAPSRSGLCRSACADRAAIHGDARGTSTHGEAFQSGAEHRYHHVPESIALRLEPAVEQLAGPLAYQGTHIGHESLDDAPVLPLDPGHPKETPLQGARSLRSSEPAVVDAEPFDLQPLAREVRRIGIATRRVAFGLVKK